MNNFNVAIRFVCTITLLTTVLVTQSYADFLQPGSRLIYGPQDTLFRLCNRSGKTLQIALIYKHYWRAGEPPSWPAKGWFVYKPGDCSIVGHNGLSGVMSVMSFNKNGDLVPYYTGGPSINEVSISQNSSTQIEPEYLCLGEAPFDEYRDTFKQYYNCKKGHIKIPFNVLFRQGGGSSFTLSLQ